MLKRNTVVVVVEVSKLDIGPVPAPGKGEEDLDLISFGGAEKQGNRRRESRTVVGP